MKGRIMEPEEQKIPKYEEPCRVCGRPHPYRVLGVVLMTVVVVCMAVSVFRLVWLMSKSEGK